MKLKQTLVGLLGIAMLANLTNSTYAQVTIGQNEAPANGALLQLKDGTSVSDPLVNASKGLALPRVRLVDLKALTMGTNIITDNPVGTWANHTGLTVYSISDGCVNENLMYPGVYTWNGTKWDVIWQNKKEDIRTIVDNGVVHIGGHIVGSFTMTYDDGVNPVENELYYYTDFGSAGIWMTQNLRTKYAPDGTPLANNTVATNIGRNKHNYAYPGNSGNGTSRLDYDANVAAGKEIGLLYDWYTATNSENCSVSDQGQVGFLSDNPSVFGLNEVESKAEKGYIKGLCPKGWHLPSDRDWNRLEKELVKNAPNYSSTTSGVWNDAWEISTGWRGTMTGEVIRSMNEVENSSYTLLNSFSNAYNMGGFDAYISGYTHNGMVINYSYHGYFWTSSTYNTNTWIRGTGYTDARIGRLNGVRENLLWVRCKKD